MLGIKKGNKLYSVLHQKCPRCHEGDLFINKNAYRIKGFFDMPHRCDHCGQLYSLEPSFFYGAMYVNYGLTVAICMAIYIAMLVIGELILGLDIQLSAYVVAIALSLVLFAPLTFRYGRAIWINMFVKYDPTALKDKKLGDHARSQ